MASARFGRDAASNSDGSDVWASWLICLALVFVLAAAGGPARHGGDPARQPPLTQEQARAPLHLPPVLPG